MVEYGLKCPWTDCPPSFLQGNVGGKALPDKLGSWFVYATSIGPDVQEEKYVWLYKGVGNVRLASLKDEEETKHFPIS